MPPETLLRPENKGTLSAKYTLPLDKSIGDISVGGTYSYTDRQLVDYNYFDPNVVAALGGDFGFVGARQLLNLQGEWSSIFSSTVDLTLFATNVTQKKYYNFIPGIGALQSGLEFATVGEPRMFGLRVRYRFGT